ncbi:fumarylacetoacetate hydrolase family protein [Amycolatopsis jejuensis]|uniref:fumarylacetoacetate hydrolase family protein n=1 Tax=Amycolatopsis jejuensis TaxID=330084 RepID=UPI0005264B66|nr:fumarylacetoacetate hydrolase family protein [Amycolatopsis jejuensis]
MRFASALIDGECAAVALTGDLAVPLDAIAELGSATPSEILANPPLVRERAVPAAGLTLRPLVPHPGKIICVGLNYRGHVTESKRELPTYPVLFVKFPESLVAHGEDIELPPESSQVDYEGELAVVIGRSGRRIAEADAWSHVAGYTVANDVTMRDYQYKTHQWLQGKSWERSTPLGPYLVTPDEVDLTKGAQLRLSVNGRELQSGNVSQMIFDIPKLISVVSEFVTLAVGDVILTGTPDGVGFRRDPQVFLTDGDVVRVEIDGVGSLENKVATEKA